MIRWIRSSHNRTLRALLALSVLVLMTVSAAPASGDNRSTYYHYRTEGSICFYVQAELFHPGPNGYRVDYKGWHKVRTSSPCNFWGTGFSRPAGTLSILANLYKDGYGLCGATGSYTNSFSTSDWGVGQEHNLCGAGNYATYASGDSEWGGVWQGAYVWSSSWHYFS